MEGVRKRTRKRKYCRTTFRGHPHPHRECPVVCNAVVGMPPLLASSAAGARPARPATQLAYLAVLEVTVKAENPQLRPSSLANQVQRSQLIVLDHTPEHVPETEMFGSQRTVT